MKGQEEDLISWQNVLHRSEWVVNSFNVEF